MVRGDIGTIVIEAELDERGKMLRFWRNGEPPAIGNAEPLPRRWLGTEWMPIG